MNNKLLSWLILVILTLIWGSSFILMKQGLLSFDPIELGSLRISLAFLSFLPLIYRAWKKVPKSQVKYVILAGLTGNFFPAFMFAKAQTELSSSLTGVLNSLTPIFTMLIGVLIFSQKLKTLQVIGLVLAFSGALSLSLVKNNGEVGEMNFYVFYVLAATFFYGLSANILKHKLSNIPSLDLSVASLSTVGVLSMLILFFMTDFLPKVSTGEHWHSFGYVFLLGFFGTAVGLILFNKLIQITDAVFGSLVTYMMPVVAIAWGLTVNEPITASHLVGICLILSGVILANRASQIKK